MSGRDDFSAGVKELLAKRVAYKCSNLDCRNQTLGPQEAALGTVSVGFAAHIKAASPGGKRYDANQTSDQRSSQDNGIWLCGTCAKLIDSDEVRFPVSLLNAWKLLAEETARQEIGKPAQKNIPTVTTVYVHAGEEKRPQLDIASGVAHSGGADGHSLLFAIKNEGSDIASEITCYLGDVDTDSYEQVPVPSKLGPNEQSREINYKVDHSPLFLKKLATPELRFGYKSKEGVIFETTRSLVQDPRADGRFNLKEGDQYKDSPRYIKVEIEDISISQHSRTADGLVDSFSLTIKVLLRNFSQNSSQVRAVSSSLITLDGYESVTFGNGFTETNDLAARGVLTRTLQFLVSLKGRGQGTAEGVTLFNDSKSRALAAIGSGNISLVFEAVGVSVLGTEIIKESFDLTKEVTPFLK